MIKENKTGLFKKHIQMIIMEVTGQKVSQDKAWQLFKAMQAGTLEFVANIEAEKGAKTLSLAGVGKFQIKETEPQGKKAGMVKVLDENGEPKKDAEGKVIEVRDENLPVWDVVPRYKFTPSSAVNEQLFAIYNCPGAKKEILKNTGIFKAEQPEEEDEAVEIPVIQELPEKEVEQEVEPVRIDDVDFF